MKAQKPCLIAAIVCLLVVFFSGFAYAESLGEIIDEFCIEVLEDSVDALEEEREASADLVECVDEFANCVDGGLFGGDSVPECINEGFQCTSFAQRDQLQACDHYASDFELAYDRAVRQAIRSDVENGFQLWLNSPASQECLRPAVTVSAVCAEVID
jgi:hypothetical protein